MSGASFDYKFGQKNNWRRWAWNRLADRIADRRNAVIIYLAGRNDLDREVALSKGFRECNLIAVEKDAEALEHLRRAGKLTIDGTLADVMHAWPSDRKVNGVIADLCSGLDMSYAWDNCISYPAFTDSVFVINMLRGRDQSSNSWREHFSTKHRGELLFIGMVQAIIDRSYVGSYGIHLAELVMRKDIENGSMSAIRRHIISQCDAKFNSYKSTSGQVFDSVVFKSPVEDMLKMCYRETYDVILKEVLAYRKNTRNVSQSRRISAILAHRTMRMQGA